MCTAAAPVEDGGVIEPDVLWSCTTCGACVEQCPVDIEQVDHILDMRRYQVMVESSFPSEASSMMRNLENEGNPWGSGDAARLTWTEGLDFDVRVITDRIPDDVEYLFWVGCAGALEDRSRRTTQAIAPLPHTADYHTHLERPVFRLSTPPQPPQAAWINKSDDQEEPPVNPEHRCLKEVDSHRHPPGPAAVG